MSDRLLNAHQVADLMGLRNYRSVYARLDRAGLTQVRDGRMVRWYEDEINAWIRRNSHVPRDRHDLTSTPNAYPFEAA